jgi:hypothetical protein
VLASQERPERCGLPAPPGLGEQPPLPVLRDRGSNGRGVVREIGCVEGDAGLTCTISVSTDGRYGLLEG